MYSIASYLYNHLYLLMFKTKYTIHEFNVYMTVFKYSSAIMVCQVYATLERDAFHYQWGLLSCVQRRIHVLHMCMLGKLFLYLMPILNFVTFFLSTQSTSAWLHLNCIEMLGVFKLVEHHQPGIIRTFSFQQFQF